MYCIISNSDTLSEGKHGFIEPKSLFILKKSNMVSELDGGSRKLPVNTTVKTSEGRKCEESTHPTE